MFIHPHYMKRYVHDIRAGQLKIATTVTLC